jgi:DNA-binding GntR family transcriptional regulator
MSTSSRSEPLYLKLAHTLAGQIKAGQFPVGTLLPGEWRLCSDFGASRFTIREALQQLELRGLVFREAGIGTRVTAMNPEPSKVHALCRSGRLSDSAADPGLHVTSHQTLEIDSHAPAELSGAKAGEIWLKIEGFHYAMGAPDPACNTVIYVHPLFRTIAAFKGWLNVPVHIQVEREFGERIAHLQREIKACTLSPQSACALGGEPGAPALTICRRYLNARYEVIVVSVSTHPADRYRCLETFCKDGAEPMPMPVWPSLSKPRTDLKGASS